MSRRAATLLCAACAVATLPASWLGCADVSDSGSDGGDEGDGGSCTMSFSVMPDPPTRGVEVQLSAEIDEGATVGFQEYSWTVRRGTAPLEIDGSDEQIVEFVALEAGVHSIELAGSVGGEPCIPDVHDINVREPGAAPQSFRLRAVPPPGDPALPPPQDLEVQLYGATDDYSLDEVGLAPGTEVSGVSLDHEGAPIAAYLRTRRLDADGPPLYGEAFAAADGSYLLRLIDADHELLVIPDDPAVHPYRRRPVGPADLSNSTAVAPGDVFAVSVRAGPGGDAPVEGAAVTLVADGVPSSVAVTDASGVAALEVDADRAAPAAVSVVVVPPEEQGLPQLELPASLGLELAAGGGGIAVVYDAGLSSRTVAPAVRLTDGTTPAVGSRVTWIARPIEAAGTIDLGGGPQQAAGVVRRTAVVDIGGATADTVLPEAVYDAVVDPPEAADRTADAPSATEIDLRSGTGDPALLTLAAPATLRGQVMAPGPRPGEGEGGPAPLAGARVQATPRRGVLLAAPLAGASAITNEQGEFQLLVAGGGEYEITIDGAARRQGRVRVLATAPAPGGSMDLGAVELPRVLRAKGILTAASGGGRLAHTHLQLFCYSCGPDESAAPVAEAITDDDGRFVLIAPDPGLTEPP